MNGKQAKKLRRAASSVIENSKQLWMQQESSSAENLMLGYSLYRKQYKHLKRLFKELPHSKKKSFLELMQHMTPEPSAMQNSLN